VVDRCRVQFKSHQPKPGLSLHGYGVALQILTIVASVPLCCAGMALEYKQKGTPDVNHKGYKSYGKGRRFAGVLQPQERWVALF
jgi:hypothetical protein